MKQETLEALVAARQNKRPVVLATRLKDGEERLIDPLGSDDPLLGEAREAMQSDKSRLIGEGDEATFLHVYNPPLRMIIVGAVHIAQPLAGMARTAGYDVTVVDPRGAFIGQDRFPGVTIRAEWPDDALIRLGVDHRTAIVTLTHDPKVDDPALHIALRSPAFYIGCLGSTRTHAKRIERLAGEGFASQELARIHGPVGLDIAAKSPAEIAISILGEVTQALRRGDTKIAAAS